MPFVSPIHTLGTPLFTSKCRRLLSLQRRERQRKLESELHSHRESNLRNALFGLLSRDWGGIQNVNDGLVAYSARSILLNERACRILHSCVVGIIVELLLHDFTEHLAGDVAGVSDYRHARDSSSGGEDSRFED